jgi:hypothetical protein
MVEVYYKLKQNTTAHNDAVELIVLGMSVSPGRFQQICHGFIVYKPVASVLLLSADLKRNLEGLTFEVSPGHSCNAASLTVDTTRGAHIPPKQVVYAEREADKGRQRIG